MGFAFTGGLEEELKQVDTMCKENLQIWWDDLAFLRESLRDDKSLHLMPATVVLAYKYLDSDHTLAIDMASLFKTLYFAHLIHKQVKDEEEGQRNNQELQFTILIGDYIFGRVLKLLLKIGAVQVLDSLALMICKINEGLVIEHKFEAEGLEIIKRGAAVIYETAFLTAARLKGLDYEAAELYGQLGFNVGMVLELMIADDYVQSRFYIEQSFNLLTEFENLAGFKDNCLDDFLQGLAKDIHAVTSSAAI